MNTENKVLFDRKISINESFETDQLVIYNKNSLRNSKSL